MNGKNVDQCIEIITVVISTVMNQAKDDRGKDAGICQVMFTRKDHWKKERKEFFFN